MNRSRRLLTALATVSILLAALGQARADMMDPDELNITEFSGTFDSIDVPGDGSTFELLDGRITLTAPDTLPDGEQLTIVDVTVDLTGYDDLDGGDVGIVGGSVIIENPASDTNASLAVNSATLTQVLNSPIGVGFLSLRLGLLGSGLTTGEGDTINLDVRESVITFNGIEVTLENNSDGTNGKATLGTLTSASISAVIPEPSTLVLGLMTAVGLAGYGWRRRRSRLP